MGFIDRAELIIFFKINTYLNQSLHLLLSHFYNDLVGNIGVHLLMEVI
jgi:hypothetical protein